MAAMSTGHDPRDDQAPLPYVRRKTNFTPEEIEFRYDKPTVAIKTITREWLDEQNHPMQETITETIAEERTKKKILRCYGHSSEEDIEHFFEAFERFRKQLETEWQESSQAKTRDARILFDAFDAMLIGTASAEWHDTLGDELGRTWEHFKTNVSKFICTKILPDDAYKIQVRHMQERKKPASTALTSVQWWSRIQTINRYLVFFFPSLEALQEHFPAADFRAWWKSGPLSTAELRRIITNRVPDKWQDQVQKVDMGHEYRERRPIEDLINYCTTLESMEKKNVSARYTPRGRGMPLRQPLRQPMRPGFNQFHQRPWGNLRNNRLSSGRNAQNTGVAGGNNNIERTNNDNQGQQSRALTLTRSPGRNQAFAIGRGNRNPGAQQGGRNNNNFQRRGRFQGQRFGNPHQRPNQSYLYEEDQQGDALADQEDEGLNIEDSQTAEEGEMTMEEIARWNESLYLGADDFTEEDEQFAMDEYEDDEDYGYDDCAAQGGRYV